MEIGTKSIAVKISEKGVLYPLYNNYILCVEK